MIGVSFWGTALLNDVSAPALPAESVTYIQRSNCSRKPQRTSQQTRNTSLPYTTTKPTFQSPATSTTFNVFTMPEVKPEDAEAYGQRLVDILQIPTKIPRLQIPTQDPRLQIPTKIENLQIPTKDPRLQIPSQDPRLKRGRIDGVV
ncbi:hypothetical protein AC578_7886 [Pseudocercospora eumusae]|uniref:Uncharacterized protein n=1 Tax=Pseudocercospora eumusae TaxID=321146 RepID=A0A139H060_9PEZI|nr:hypothetical protein AC578_7886 [Pseudocercospora eumusae]